MDGAVVAFAFIVACLAAIWYYFGPMGIILLIAVIIFGGYKLLHSDKHKDDSKYDSSEYVKKAMRFIEFYMQMPRKTTLIVTPEFIGARIPSDSDNDYFGVTVSTYLQSGFQDVFFQHAKESLGGERGVALFQELNLQVKLHDGDDDWPIVYMDLFEFDSQKREKCVHAIEKQYEKLYHKEVKIYHLREY